MKKIATFISCMFGALALHAGDILIRDINLIPMTGKKVIAGQSVLIRDGRILAIGKNAGSRAEAGAQVIEGKGRYLMPGLTDMHVHLPEPARTDTLLLMNIAAGVTHIRVTNARKLQQQELKQRLAQAAAPVSPKIIYSYLIGKQVQRDEKTLDSLMLALKQQQIRFIKLFSVADEKAFDQLMAAARRNGMTVYGHYPAYAQGEKMIPLPMDKVLASGFGSIEHLGGYEDLEQAAAISKAVKQTRQHGVFNCPTLDWDMIGFDQLYPDAYRQRITYNLVPAKYTGYWEKKYTEDIEKAGGSAKVIADRDAHRPVLARKQEVLKQLAANNCPLLIGSDATGVFQADGFNVYEEMMNWSRAGLDNYTILKSATHTAALFAGEADRWGTIEAGKDADLIILEQNPLEDISNITTVCTTLIDGRIYHKKDIMAQL
ncbi:amidohydrolase family protein [Taibaiella chishuiensis]|uniref:Imidazolonepropionase-like amidohydrolase n=1 Tax=Taibaiella chishuiensis TaxID=1434707 RepID=A0A2P8DB27_9BACT|nr:amidohydrolase family protein [Taibaiella chishuiensis]PSK94405.1 imidazolonepropionase-like amidohydrolase [Taibaiella chishuiensis]